MIVGMDLASTIAGIKNKVLPATYCGEKEQPGILFTLDMRVSSHENGDSFNAAADIGVLIVNPHSVFVAERLNRPFCFVDAPLDQWKNTSNHNSCWKSDGLLPLTETYFRLCEEINELRVEAGLPKIASKDMSTNIFYWGDLWTDVKVQTAKIDGEHYKRKVVSLSLA